MRTNGLVFEICCGLALTAAAGSAQGGSITGIVVDDLGKPVANAHVVYRNDPKVARGAGGRPVITGRRIGSGVKTAADGSFTIAALPSDTYHLCAYGSRDNHLGSCEWLRGNERAIVTDSGTARVHLTIAEGTLVTFHVQDPRRQVRDLESLQTTGSRMPVAGANFAVGIWAGTRYVRAKLVSASGALRRYQLAIPKTADVRLYLDTLLDVVDSRDVALPLRSLGETITAGGRPEVVVDLTVR